MTKFSIKNIFVYWLRMWPMTLVLLVLGSVGGIATAVSMRQSYVSTANILVVNSDSGVVPTDYVGILNSPSMIDGAKRTIGVGDDCALLSSGSGNVLTIISDCFSSKENSERLASETISAFTQKVKELYGNDNVSVDNLFEKIEAKDAISEQDYAARVVMAVLAGLLLSGVIAFVRFDYTNSKQQKK